MKRQREALNRALALALLVVLGARGAAAGDDRSRDQSAQKPQPWESAAERDRGIRDRQLALLKDIQILRSSTVGARPPQTLSSPGNYSLSVDADLHVEGHIFKNGRPFLHDDGTTARNVAVGHLAMVSLTPYQPYYSSGVSNTALGSYAMRYTSSGSFNSGVGAYALNSNTIGSSNSALGAFALFSNTEGYSNTAVGTSALSANLGGVENTAVGISSLASNDGGDSNTALGALALATSTSASGNTAVGSHALTLNLTGYHNAALGSWALSSNDVGKSNTALGAHSLILSRDGEQNTAVGASALSANTSGSRNTALGTRALEGNSTGSDNIAIGYRAGFSMTGTGNIVIGTNGSAGEHEVTRIGETQAAAYVAGIWGTTSPSGTQVLVNDDGKLGTMLSSRRFKEEIAPMADASVPLLDLEPVTFRYTEESAGAGARSLEYGLIAEDVAEILPALVVYDETGEPYSVRYHLLAPMLLNEVQRLRRQVDVLEAQNREIDDLKARLERLEQM